MGAYIIAECGLNHRGSWERLETLVNAAAHAGADAVKFQLFDPETVDRPEAVRAILRPLVLDLRNAPRLARDCNLDPIVTPFGPDMLALAETQRWSAYKVSHAESHDDGWIDRLKRTGRRVIVSYSRADRRMIGYPARPFFRTDIDALWCCPDYPTRIEDVSWEAVSHVGGFSDHTGDVRAGGLAAAAGARIIEAHITEDRNAPGPDHTSSIEVGDFPEYVRRIREVTTA